MWTCSWDECSKPAVQRQGDCSLCDKHLCCVHLGAAYHKCPNPEDWASFSQKYIASEDRCLNELCSKINPDILCSLASEIRRDQNRAVETRIIPCTADVTPKQLRSMMGGQNCHVVIRFEDNVEWIARFRLTPRATSPPCEIRDYILRSEAATLAYLGQHTTLPVPKLFSWASESDPANPFHIGYILMEKMEGKVLKWDKSTAAEKEKIMQQLADIFLEIEKHPFNAMGSIMLDAAGDFKVEGLASHHATFQWGDTAGPLGPFASSLEGSRAIIQSYLTLAAKGETDITHSIDAYLAYRLRLEFASSIWPDEAAGHHHQQQFFLKHPDDKGDHILINDDFDIIGIIDWEWTQTVSRAEAFSTPCMMWPVAEFHKGMNELSKDEMRLAGILQERGREDLARCIKDGRKVQRFYFALGPESASLPQNKFVSLCDGLKQALEPENDQRWEEWRDLALKMWEKDSLLQELLRLEDSAEDNM